MKKFADFFGVSSLVTIIGLSAIYFIFGFNAFWIASLLVLLEVTLSFDNAVVNARVLQGMNEVWQHRFLTWGIFIAVFGTRFILPILIVSIVTWASPILITQLALFNSAQYATLLESSGYAIHSFGASFLLMVALKYFLDTKKDLHWIEILEKRLSRWGHIDAIEIVLALISIAGISFLVPFDERTTVLVSGIFGVVLFIVMQGITSAFEIGSKAVVGRSLALFMYLEVLDASFSLDGVIGAFALTSLIPIIAVGLGIGAFFIRSLTIFMVKERTLDTLKYLEHGAHWAIFALAISMLVSMLLHVPEFVTGTIGVVFVLAAYYSSLEKKKKRNFLGIKF